MLCHSDQASNSSIKPKSRHALEAMNVTGSHKQQTKNANRLQPTEHASKQPTIEGRLCLRPNKTTLTSFASRTGSVLPGEKPRWQWRKGY